MRARLAAVWATAAVAVLAGSIAAGAVERDPATDPCIWIEAERVWIPFEYYRMWHGEWVAQGGAAVDLVGYLQWLSSAHPDWRDSNSECTRYAGPTTLPPGDTPRVTGEARYLDPAARAYYAWMWHRAATERAMRPRYGWTAPTRWVPAPGRGIRAVPPPRFFAPPQPMPAPMPPYAGLGGPPRPPWFGGGAAGPGMFRNCDEARAAGRSNIRAGDPSYSLDLDGEGDGIACESRGRR